jgi:hypothetical protein
MWDRPLEKTDSFIRMKSQAKLVSRDLIQYFTETGIKARMRGIF